MEPLTHSLSSSSSSSASDYDSIFLEDRVLSESSQSDYTPPHSPVKEEPVSLARLTLSPSLLTREKFTIEQAASRFLDAEKTPRLSTPKSGSFPWIRSEVAGEGGYESEVDDRRRDRSKLSNSPASPRPQLLRSESKRIKSEVRRSRLATPPAALPDFSASPTIHSSSSATPSGSTRAARLKRSMAIDLGTVPAYVYKSKIDNDKTPMGLGIGFPSIHPALRTPRAASVSYCPVQPPSPPTHHLAPTILSPMSPRSEVLLPKMRLRPTDMLNSPSPMEGLPPMISMTTLAEAHIAQNSPILDSPKKGRLRPQFTANMPSPMELLPSPLLPHLKNGPAFSPIGSSLQSPLSREVSLFPPLDNNNSLAQTMDDALLYMAGEANGDSNAAFQGQASLSASGIANTSIVDEVVARTARKSSYNPYFEVSLAGMASRNEGI